jgi:hypothetical protein
MTFDFVRSMMVEPLYEPRFIKDSEAKYVFECWHAARGVCDTHMARLKYVVRHFIRKYPQYEGRSTAVYKDVCGLVEL